MLKRARLVLHVLKSGWRVVVFGPGSHQSPLRSTGSARFVLLCHERKVVAFFGSARDVPDDPIVSVIIPSFNVDAYLDDCVRSVVEQTYEHLDIVLVDDGSTDSTGVIVDRWATTDDRIVAVHQLNQGLGAARNAGVGASTGSFIFFLDSDDMLPSDSIGRMVDSARRSGSDIVSGVAWRFDSSGTWRADQYRAPFDRDTIATHLFREPLLVYDQMACSKLIRRDFWEQEQLAFPTGTTYEDLEVVMRAHCRAASVDLVAAPSYWWRRRESGDVSITQDRYRVGSTAARFDALRRADSFLRDEAPVEVWVAHGVKVLLVDVRLYSRLLEGAGEAFVDEFMESAGRLASAIAPDAVCAVNPVMRQLHRYLTEANTDGVIACVRLLSGSGGRSVGQAARGIGWFVKNDAGALLELAASSSPLKPRRVRRATST